MRRTKPTTIYRSLLSQAWEVTWHRKSLWIFGIFAGLISTGGVFDIAISGMKKAQVAGSLFSNMMDRTFIGYAYVSEFISYLAQSNSVRETIIATLIILILIGLFVCGIISQAALVHSSGEPNKHPREIRQHVLVHFWNVFFVEVITKILFLVLTGLISLPVLLYIQNKTEFSSQILFTHFLLFIPAVIILHIISLLALIDVVESKTDAISAFQTALVIFKKQWLATIEFGFLLFLVLFVSIFVLLSIIILLSIPLGFLITATLAIGSITLFSLLNIIIALIIFSIILAFGGALVTFQYSAWKFFYKLSVHKTQGTKTFSKLFRMVS